MTPLEILGLVALWTLAQLGIWGAYWAVTHREAARFLWLSCRVLWRANPRRGRPFSAIVVTPQKRLAPDATHLVPVFVFAAEGDSAIVASMMRAGLEYYRDATPDVWAVMARQSMHEALSKLAQVAEVEAGEDEDALFGDGAGFGQPAAPRLVQ